MAKKVIGLNGEVYYRVRISSASARQPFHGCTPQYIRDVCHARCCDAPSEPTGMLVTIHPSERHKVEAAGGRVRGMFLQPEPGCRGCPFKQQGTYLCGLHETPAKPFGCIASPFTLNKSGTLIIRNRYRMLKCFNVEPRLPAYVAFRASLDLIFGATLADAICRHLDSGGGDIVVRMPEASYTMLVENDDAKHQRKPGR